MKISIRDGLPLVQVIIKYKDKEKLLGNVLLDTGSSNTIFDVDVVEEIDLLIDPVKGVARRMFGVVGEYSLKNFTLQLGITQETYGLEGILGVDFMLKNGIIVDFKKMIVK